MRRRSTTVLFLAGAGVSGAIVGAGSVAATASGRDAITNATRAVGAASGMMRRRAPQPGDHWRGCDDARAAGTAPIYREEPGYRPEMDGDDDGIACEAYRGS